MVVVNLTPSQEMIASKRNRNMQKDTKVVANRIGANRIGAGLKSGLKTSPRISPVISHRTGARPKNRRIPIRHLRYLQI
jgi:hypothetical protein